MSKPFCVLCAESVGSSRLLAHVACSLCIEVPPRQRVWFLLFRVGNDVYAFSGVGLGLDVNLDFFVATWGALPPSTTFRPYPWVTKNFLSAGHLQAAAWFALAIASHWGATHLYGTFQTYVTYVTYEIHIITGNSKIDITG